MSSFRPILASLVLALAGCASVPPAPPAAPADPQVQIRHQQQLSRISAFSLHGRMALQTEKRGFSGSMHWTHTEDANHFLLYSPLGAQVAEIQSNAEGVTLKTDEQHTFTAANAELLLQQTMGWSLPLTGLSDWALGRPANAPYETLETDAQGRITHLVQQGWDIRYSSYQSVEGIDLPSKMLLHSQQLDLKLLVEHWGTLGREP